MIKKALRAAVILVAVFGVLTNIAGLINGCSLIWGIIRIHLYDLEYFEYAYLLNGILWLVISLAGIVAAILAIIKRSYKGILPTLSVAIGLMSMVALPNVGPRLQMMMVATELLGHADHSLADWDEVHGKFPVNEEELRTALSKRPLGEKPVFLRKGQHIPFTIGLRSSASGPVMNDIPQQPGMIMYAVAPDYSEYWLTITTLRNPVGGPVVFHHVAGDYERGRVWVMNRTHHKPGDGYKPYLE